MPFWVQFDPQSALKRSKNCSILLHVCKSRANLQLLWVIISAIGNFDPSRVRNHFSVQISSFWWATFREMGNFWPFLTPRVPQNSQNLWFVLNEWQCKICDQKLYLWANILLLGVIFRGTGILTFLPTLTLGCPKMGQNLWFDKNKCHNQILHAKLCIYVKF